MLSRDDALQLPFHSSVCRKLFALKQKYLDHCRMISIGQSVLGKELYAIVLGRMEHATLYVGGVHGSEWLTVLVLLRYLEDLLSSIAQNQTAAEINVKKMVEKRGLIVLPALNPDGIEIALRGPIGAGYFGQLVQSVKPDGNFREWKANCRGVDLNHNFRAGWELLHRMEQEDGIWGPRFSQYGGFAPESEPEVQALCRLCRRFSIRQAYAFHSQGEEIYYQYEKATPKKSFVTAKLLAQASGYELAKPQGLASHGGFKDWFIQEFRRPGFTIEIGKGKNPLPLSELEKTYEKLRQMLFLAPML